ncbi:MAG: SDR family oxidoreductase [bacterium]
MHVVDFAKAVRARLVHISTCFVCGKTGGGHANETLQPDYNPKGETFSAEREYEEALEAAGREAPPGQDRFQVCRDRALRWGWPNGYTYTKSLAESLLQNRAENLSYTVVRPAIVESAMKFPFPGWNEGAETCTPISYLAGNGIKHFTARKHYTLDIVPVDAVCESIAIAGAALLNGVAFSVYQCGSSFRNPLKIGRMLELIALAHRAHYRRHGGTTTERLLLSRWDAVTVSEESFFSVGSLREAAVRLNQFAKQWEAKTSGFLKEWIHSATVLTHRAKWALIKAEKIIRIFLPFIYENHFRFVCENLEKHEVREEEFRFEPGKIDWRHYILDIHEPGIRKWCYPLIENKPVEKLNLSYPFRLSEEGGEREFPRRVSRG